LVIVFFSFELFNKLNEGRIYRAPCAPGSSKALELKLLLNGLIDLKQSSVALKNKILKNPEKFISYLELFIVNVERLNSSFQLSENSIEKVVQKLHKYKNSISS